MNSTAVSPYAISVDSGVSPSSLPVSARTTSACGGSELKLTRTIAGVAGTAGPGAVTGDCAAVLPALPLLSTNTPATAAATSTAVMPTVLPRPLRAGTISSSTSSPTVWRKVDGDPLGPRVAD